MRNYAIFTRCLAVTAPCFAFFLACDEVGSALCRLTTNLSITADNKIIQIRGSAALIRMVYRELKTCELLSMREMYRNTLFFVPKHVVFCTETRCFLYRNISLHNYAILSDLQQKTRFYAASGGLCKIMQTVIIMRYYAILGKLCGTALIALKDGPWLVLRKIFKFIDMKDYLQCQSIASGKGCLHTSSIFYIGRHG